MCGCDCGHHSFPLLLPQSGSHRLEITPADEEPGDTVLRLSDLASEGTESIEAIVVSLKYCGVSL